MSAEQDRDVVSVRMHPVIPFDALAVDLIPSADQARAARVWTMLEERIGHGGLTCSWAWTETWLKHFGAELPHWFAVGRLDDEPVAIALLVLGNGLRRGPFHLKTLHIGTAGEQLDETLRVECNRVLVAPHLRRVFARGLVATARRTLGGFDLLCLDGFAPEEIAPFQKADLDLVFERKRCWVADLAEARGMGAPILSRLRRHTAAKIRRTARRLEATHGPLRVEWAENPAQAGEFLSELAVLHQARWRAAGKPGVFANERFFALHRDLVRRLFPLGRVMLARVRAGDITVGCDYGFIEHNRVLSYQWGVARFEDPRLSPGLLVGALAMQAALERGLDEYDWLAGDVLYKRELSTTSRELVWAWAPTGFKMRALDAAAAARNWSEQRRSSAMARLGFARGRA